jgi:hypothetical protein
MAGPEKKTSNVDESHESPDQMNVGSREIFRYGSLRWIAPCLSLLMTGMVTWILGRAGLLAPSADMIYFFVIVPVMAVAVLAAPVAYRDVVISEAGIGRAFFGLSFGLVPWDKVKSVRCGVLKGKDRAVTGYHLRTRIGSPFGGVRVLSLIDDVDRLVSAIEVQVLKCGVPVTAWDVDTLITVDRLPPPVKGEAAWK